MNQFSFYAGIDVSKQWLDIALLAPSEGIVHEKRILNTVKDVTSFLKSLPKLAGVKCDQILFCLEHTGKYGNAFLKASALLKAKVWIESAVQIKRSQGLVRGKTDQWDAIRIAEYAYRFYDKAVLWEPMDTLIEELKDLQGKRDLLVKTCKQLSQDNKKDPIMLKPLVALKSAIKSIEQKMEKLVSQNGSYQNQYDLLKTVPGIGKQTGIALIIVTRGFTRLTESRKLSCYAGLAPFPYRSGSSIKGRTKVSKMGDMKLKCLLNLSAWNAIRSIPALKEYYIKKVAVGKHKLSVINVVRNKLVAMALSVIKRNSPFTKDYSVSFT